MYSKIGEISEDCRGWLQSQVLQCHYRLQKTSDRDFESAEAIELGLIECDELFAFWDRCRWMNALVVVIPPQGFIPPHRHWNDKKKTKYHVVLSTNDQCTCVNGGVESHLELRGVYRMAPMLMHESFNQGQTGRTHLIMEIVNG